MSLSSNKGAILEEVILHLLDKLGFRIVAAGEEGTRKGSAGTEVQGRGEWHQIDAFAAFDYTPAFIYPLRLLFEAKCYSKKFQIGVDVVRNAVGVLKDISENYFSFSSSPRTVEPVMVPRFNYVSAIFSTSGYSATAQRYAIAHQIFLVQYRNNYLFAPISQGLIALKKGDFKPGFCTSKDSTKKVRCYVRWKLGNQGDQVENPFSESGSQRFSENIFKPVQKIGGSYFGMLQGRWPLHLLSTEPLPNDLFADRDTIPCEVYGRNGKTWSFVPLNVSQNSPSWFRLEFDLPDKIARLVEEAEGDRQTIANLKSEHFSFITLSGMIGGVRRQLRLKMDRGWLTQYLGNLQD